MFHRVLILFSVISSLTLSSAMAQEDLFLGEIKNPSRKGAMSKWGLRLEASYSDTDLEVPDISSSNVDVKNLEFEITLSKLIGKFEPLISFGFQNLESTSGSEATEKNQVFSVSGGFIFNIISHKNSVVPFLSMEFGYQNGTLEAVNKATYGGFAWSAGGGIKFFLSKSRNIALVGQIHYADTLDNEFELLNRTVDMNLNGIGSSLGFVLYL